MGLYTCPSPISWLNREETGAHLVEELGRLSVLLLAQGPRKEGIHHWTEPSCIPVLALRGGGLYSLNPIQALNIPHEQKGLSHPDSEDTVNISLGQTWNWICCIGPVAGGWAPS